MPKNIGINYFEIPPIDETDKQMREALSLFVAGLLKMEYLITDIMDKDPDVPEEAKKSDQDLPIHARTALELMAITNTMLQDEDWWKYMTEYVDKNVIASVVDSGLE